MASLQGLSGLKAVWRYFEEITQVPRPSKKEGRIIAYLERFATDRGLEHKKDATGNIVIRKGATPGMEGRPTVVLQSHMDMVCEKNSEVVFDFEREAIRTTVVDGWVKAQGTTLGADDGIGMAAALAVLSADDLPHGPIEALFTVDEETGLTGAFGLAEGMISGKYLINLDSEDEGEIFIGCAGGVDTVARMRYIVEPVPLKWSTWQLSLRGLTGGHSGDDIEKGHANANKLITRFLWRGERDFSLRLANFDGGNLRNAIPREAVATFAVPIAEEEKMTREVELFRSEITDEFKFTEKNIALELENSEAEEVLAAECQKKLLDVLRAVPNGVLTMSQTMPGLVETSTNLASVKFDGTGTIVLTTSQRSSVESARRDAMESVESCFVLAGAIVEHSEGYPGWGPDPSSHLLAVTVETYEKLFGEKPKIRAIHAGLECGLFLKKYPHLEMVSFGPTLRGVHSPDERLEIASVERFWVLLCQILPNLA
ncbi:MAG: aminoacyl-histidine dipeptidase [Rikenellaceae bacterium]|jgi:dipeptidase D|nr:aminoacyl-histidine dipeptidase [Rikenellaceae bacterium]